MDDHIAAIADHNNPGWAGSHWILNQRAFRAICSCGWQAKYWHCWTNDEAKARAEAEADALSHTPRLAHI